MLNYFIVNELEGLNKKHELCSCGYDKITESNGTGYRYSYTYRPPCPECKGLNIYASDKLFFGTKQIKSIIFSSVISKDSYYNFELKIGIINTSISTDFVNQKMKLNTDKDCIELYNKIIFDGRKKADEMITFLDAKNNKVITEEEFINNFSRDFEGYDTRTGVERNLLENKTGLSLPFFNVAKNTKENIELVVSKLKELSEYCVEKEILIKSGINPYTLTGETDTDKSNPSLQLNLSPFMVKYLKEHGEQHHRALQYIQENLKEQAINYLDTFGQLNDGLSLYNIRKITALVVKANLSIKKLYKYLYQDAPLKQGLYDPSETLNLLYDSYDLAVKLELPFDKNPKALVRYHDTLSKEYSTITDDRKNLLFTEAMNSYKNMELIEKEIVEDKENNSENTAKPKKKKQLYAMILPKDAQDLIREGKVMRHCVASYVDRVIREECLIFFLRKADDIDTPFATIEVDPDTNRIRQVKCKANTRLKDAQAESFINKWCKKANVKWNGCW